MKYSQYYQEKMTEALDKKESEAWRDFYATILPKRIEKFKKKYTGTLENLEKAMQEYEGELVGRRREHIDFTLSNEYDRLLKLQFHDAVARLDQLQQDAPDKTDNPVLDSGKQPLASEIIADLNEHTEELRNQREILRMQTDIINFVLKVNDYECLETLQNHVRIAYNQQNKKQEV